MDASVSIFRREAALKGLVPLFFISGATSLVYETLWGRALHLVFGTSQVAIATVLAAFMGGLALGGFAMGRWADRVRRPLRVYGLLEAFIGLYALCLPLLLGVIVPLYLGFWRWLEPPPLLFAAFQALLVGLLLLLPTTCMGATLPLLARFVTTRLSVAGNRIGLLYGVNTAGAVLGTLLAGFFMLPAWGLNLSTFVAVAGNLLLAVGALLLSRQVDGVDEDDESGRLPVEASATTTGQVSVRPLLAVAFLAGLAALIYEMAWFRLMTLTLGGSAYAFSLMLLAFLVGLALGGWGGGRWADALMARRGRRGVLVALGFVQLGVGLVSYAMMWGYGELPYLYVDLYTVVERAPELFWPAQLLLACGLMLPPTLLMGATFPLVVRALVVHPDRLGAPVGLVYGFNTFGGILGALVAAFVLMPRLHLVGTVQVAVVVNAVACGVALVAVGWRRGPRLRALAVGIPLVVSVVVAAVPPPWEPLLMTAGMYKYVSELGSRNREHVYEYAVEGYELLYYAEGLSSVVTVARTESTGNIWLANNGKVDASTTVDMPTQMLVGHLPFIFGRELRDACVIGLASGVTAGAVTLHPELEHIDVVELEPAVLRASHFFDEHNHRPLDDPRTRAIFNDGRNHMLLTPPGSYDLVVSEPSNPWLSGVSNLFTLEFFHEGKRRLRPGGIWSQWIQMYGMGTAELRTLLATFAEVFPYVQVFATIEDADLVLLGSDAPLNLDARLVEGLFRDNAAVAHDMDLIKVTSPYHLLTRFQMDRDLILQMTEAAPLNTDDNMLVEFAAPRHLHEETSSDNYLVLLSEARPPLEALTSREDHLRMAEVYRNQNETVKALLVLKEWVINNPDDAEAKAVGREYQAALREKIAAAEEGG